LEELRETITGVILDFQQAQRTERVKLSKIDWKKKGGRIIL
jgi:hypothetical protein